MAEKVDRRVRKTKGQLKLGLATLMQKQSIDGISVKELVEFVNINRSTFYLHYADIYHLLDEMEDELLEEIRRIIRQHPMGIEEHTFSFMEDIFQVFGKNKEIAKALMGENGDPAFVQKLRNILEENVMKHLEVLFPDIKNDLVYTFAFCLSGCLGIMNRWLFENGTESPEHMAKIMFSMVIHALDLDEKYEELLKTKQMEEYRE